VEQIKKSSSKWLKTYVSDFAWQNGYGCFSISNSDVEAATRYIANQQEHHQHSTYEEELIKLFHEFGIEYNEQFLWN
jgi:putative transposase